MAGLVGNKLGRKKTIVIGCVIMIIGGVIQTAIYGAAQLIVGRLISGVGNGLLRSLKHRASDVVTSADIL